ncbi:MAG: hypothetical protein AVDCRST_MAG50-3088, partial [uncultured Acidimicrobiales bacterium]
APALSHPGAARHLRGRPGHRAPPAAHRGSAPRAAPDRAPCRRARWRAGAGRRNGVRRRSARRPLPPGAVRPFCPRLQRARVHRRSVPLGNPAEHLVDPRRDRRWRQRPGCGRLRPGEHRGRPDPDDRLPVGSRRRSGLHPERAAQHRGHPSGDLGPGRRRPQPRLRRVM